MSANFPLKIGLIPKAKSGNGLYIGFVPSHRGKLSVNELQAARFRPIAWSTPERYQEMFLQLGKIDGPGEGR